VHYLVARPEIDGNRIAVVGYSMGGFPSVAAIAGAADWLSVKLADPTSAVG
jgi:dienelactone hydrolase